MRSIFREHTSSGSWTSVALGTDRLDIARIERQGNGLPAVQQCASYARPGSDVEALRSLRKLMHPGAHGSMLLAQGEYQMHLVEAPPVPAEELRAAVRWKLKDLLDYPVDQATIDVADVPRDSSGGRAHYVHAVSARNETIAARMKLFDEARFPLSVIDVPEMAQRNLARLFEEPNRGLALLVFDDTGGLLTFTAGGELYLSRHTEISLDQLSSGDGAAAESVLERLVLELQRSLDSFDRQFGQLALSRLLLAPLPAALGVQAYLAEHLYVPVQTLDLSQVLDLRAVPELREPAKQTFALHVLGAALREHVPASRRT